MARLFSSLAFTIALSVPRSSGAAPVNTAPAVAHPSGGQEALAVAFDAKGQLHAAVCAHEPCSLDHSTEIAVPEAPARRATSARLTIAAIGRDRRAIVVEIPEADGGAAWAAVLAAPLSGDKPIVAFTGFTGAVEGLEGERTGPMVLISDGVYVGTENEGRDLCGRRALLDPKALDPATLALVPAKLQRLSQKERDAATVAAVQPTSEPLPPRVLEPEWATSAAHGTSIANLVDGKSETVWAEGRGAAGRGEFVVLRAPAELPLASFEVEVAASKPDDRAAAPRDFFIATDHDLFKVSLPAEARGTNARYAIALPAPVRTGCVAIVLDTAFSNEKDAQVGLAEVAARPAISGDPATLADKVAAGGPDAEAAAVLLQSAGRAGFEALAGRFASFDENARRIALDVLDAAPCDVAIGPYLEALGGPSDAQRHHARAAFSRCAGAAGPAIAASLARASGAVARTALVDELATAAPAAFVGAVLPILGKAKSADRRIYRSGIAHAAAAPEARGILAKALSDENFDRAATLDLLRALGDLAPAYGGAAHAAFARVAAGGASFRNRFLLLGPAASLASSDEAARAFLRNAIAADPDPRVRAEASRSVRNQRAFYAELARGAGDPAVRVREAAVTALGDGHVDESATALAYRLKMDAWPLVRRAAARALSELAPNPSIDAALGAALLDDSADVRREVLRAVGVRRAVTQVDKVRERFQDAEEVDSVRAAAALSLGRLCDTASIGALTKRAVKLATPMNDEADRTIGRSALTALSNLAPADLRARLAPFFAKGVPKPITELAANALAAPPQCRRAGAPSGNARR